jgi:hypothetical protein
MELLHHWERMTQAQRRALIKAARRMTFNPPVGDPD